MLTIMMTAMVIFLLIGFPMMIPLIVGPIIIFEFFFPMLDNTFMIQQMIGGVKPMSLIAVPMFIFAADIMTKGHSSQRLIDFVMKFVGHIRGGMAITTAATCTLFGAVSGSTQATVAAIGGPLRPQLMKIGYSSAFSTALIINASDIALMIPPSIGMIIYGVVAGASVGELFIAGIGPGLLILVLFSIYSYIYSRVMNIPTQPKANWSEKFLAFRKAILAFGYPVIIIGGIYTGIFSPTEAASATVLYAFFLEYFVYKSIRLKDVPEIALSSGLVTAVVFILVGVGTTFSWTISYAKIPQQILPALLGTDPSQLRILFTIAISFFIGCMFVDPIVVIIILVPIFKPAFIGAGIDTVLVGTLVTLQAAIGSATPPFGCDIFTAIAIFRRPYWEVIKGTPPFIAILLLASIMLIVFPDIALFLRDVAFGYL